MASPANFRCSRPTFHLRFDLHCRSLQKLSFPMFSRGLVKSTPVRFPVIRASSSPSNPKPSLLKTTCVALTAAAALFSASFYLSSKHTVSVEEATVEKHLETESKNVEALLSLVKIKFESNKHDQAIEILNRLIEIDPEEQQWLVMKARILSHHCQSESAIKAFEEIIAKDPVLVDAYHYLVMEYCDSRPKLTELEKRINEAIRICEEEKKTREIRGFRMLIAHIRVIEGETAEAIRICEELVKDDPEDFRIYMFQGMVYTLMKKEDEAAKQFEHVSMVLPEKHPYRDILTETKNVSDWRFVVAYDYLFCDLSIFTKLLVLSSFRKFG